MAPENSQLLTIGIDLGGTNLRIAAFTPGIGILKSVVLPTRLEAGPEAVVDDMCGSILQLLSQYSRTYTLAGIGVGSPGPLELPSGRLHLLTNQARPHGREDAYRHSYEGGWLHRGRL